MPKIPQYESKAQFDTQVSSVRYSPESMTREFTPIKEGASALTNLGIKMMQVQDEQETNAAHAMALDKVNEIKLRADAETDLSKLPKYEDEIAKAGSDAAQYIKAPYARNAFVNDFARTQIATKYSIRSNFQDKQIKQSQADLISFVRSAQVSLPGMSEVERIALVNTVKNRISTAGNTGIIGSVDSVNMWNDFSKNSSIGILERDMQGDPAGVATELEKGKKGRYANIPEDVRTDMISKAKNLEKKQKEESDLGIAKLQDTNENNMTLAALNGKLTEEQVRSAAATSDVSAKWAKGMISYLQSPKTINATEKAETFVNLTERVQKAVDNNGWFWTNKTGFDEISNIRADIVSAMARGEITDTEGQKMIKDSQKLFDKRAARYFNEGIKKIKAHSALYADKDMQVKAKQAMYHDFIDAVRDGVNPEKAVVSSINNFIVKSVTDAETNVANRIQKAPPGSITEEQMQHTMKKYKLTREQVLERLGKK